MLRHMEIREMFGEEEKYGKTPEKFADLRPESMMFAEDVVETAKKIGVKGMGKIEFEVGRPLHWKLKVRTDSRPKGKR